MEPNINVDILNSAVNLMGPNKNGIVFSSFSQIKSN